jgi:hypothetical protein
MKGAVYYPARVASLYQAVQNISNNHFKAGSCRHAPVSVLQRIEELRSTRPKHSGGRGKRYFESAAAALGIVDAEGDEMGIVMKGSAEATEALSGALPTLPPRRLPPPKQQLKKKSPLSNPLASLPESEEDEDDNKTNGCSRGGDGTLSSSSHASGSVAEV